MTTKFRHKYAKIAHILVLYKIWRHFCMYDGIFGVGEFKYCMLSADDLIPVSVSVNLLQRMIDTCCEEAVYLDIKFNIHSEP